MAVSQGVKPRSLKLFVYQFSVEGGQSKCQTAVSEQTFIPVGVKGAPSIMAKPRSLSIY